MEITNEIKQQMNLKKGLFKGFKLLSGDELYKTCAIASKIANLMKDFKESEQAEADKDKHIKESIDYWKDYFNRYMTDTVEAYFFTIDNCTYLCYEDLDDGYRSYAHCLKLPVLDSCINFPEPIEIEYTEDYSETRNYCNPDGEIIYLLEVIKGTEEVISVFTDYSDSYYPSGVVFYKPENLVVEN